MIQRIQTVYLLIAILCVGLTLFFPFSTYGDIEFNSLEFSNTKSVTVIYPLIYNLVVSTILAILAILSFKNRKRQQLLNRINFLVLLVLLVVMFLDFSNIESALAIEKDKISYGVGMFLPIVALVAILMASRSIKKDEDLIKSMDRIR